MTTYQEAVSRLQPIIPMIFEALEAGLAASLQEHDRLRLQRTSDQHFFSHTARRVACEELLRRGLLSTNSAADGSALAMSGIQIEHNGVVLWVFRAADQVPLPSTKRKQRFFKQGNTLDGWDNLLLLWNDKDGKLVEPMYLVRPLGGDQHRHNLRVDWSGKITRKMATMREQDLELLRPEHEALRLGGEAAT